MLNREILNCGLEGTAGACQIAKGWGSCSQVAQCIDANFTPEETRPIEFSQKFPVEMSVDEVVQLREELLKRNPDDQTPLSTLIVELTPKLANLPRVYHEPFARRVVNERLNQDISGLRSGV